MAYNKKEKNQSQIFFVARFSHTVPLKFNFYIFFSNSLKDNRKDEEIERLKKELDSYKKVSQMTQLPVI